MHVVGIDIGYGWTKIVDETGERRFPSVVGSYDPPLHIMKGFQPVEPPSVTVGGMTYSVGEGALRSSQLDFTERHQGWVETPAYRALAGAALESYHETVKVVTGLPLHYYMGDRARQAKVMKHASRMVQEVEVMAQPFGTLWDLILDETGHIRRPELQESTIGVMDIGFYTTDCVTVAQFQFVQGRSVGIEVGLSIPCSQVAKDLEEEFGARVRPHAVGELLRTRQFRIHGKVHEIGEVIESRLRETALSLGGLMRSLWGRGQTPQLDLLVLTGGGAPLLSPWLTECCQAPIMMEAHAHIANARGYFKYGRYQHHHEA